MNQQPRAKVAVVAGLMIFLCPNAPAHSQTRSTGPTKLDTKAAQTMCAKGTFEVKLQPQVDEKTPDATLGRMSIDKQFHGDLEGNSKGQMLTAGTNVKGSAGYVAIEKVTGKLNGKSGTFVLQHSGTLTKGTPQLTITVVPDSGTGELVGLAGKMTIHISEGKHSYDFEYTLPASP